MIPVDAQLAGVLKATLLPWHKVIVSPQRSEEESKRYACFSV
jgi:hypothetical protein